MDGRDFGKEVERAFEAPAKALDDGIDLAKRGGEALTHNRPVRAVGRYWHTLGPGLTTGAADDDPSGIATYSQAGARYGLQLIWLTLFTFPLMAVVQEMCARIGIVSGRGLAANIRRQYPPWALHGVTALLFSANTLNIAANLNAMSAATRLVLPQLPAQAWIVLFALACLLLQIFLPYGRYAKYLKYLTLALLSYVVVALSVGLDWSEVLRSTAVPSLSFTSDQLLLLCAILGTTISPYLFFWQTSQEVEEGVLRGETSVAARQAAADGKAIRRMRVDVWSGMFFSNLIAFFIFAAAAGTLYASGITEIVTAEQAALALRPFGEAAFLLFALGIVGTGLIAVPVLAGSTAYAIAESFGWKYGLFRPLKQASAFYGVIIVSVLLGILANLFHLDPIRGLIYAAVANGLIAPVVLFFIVHISSDRRVMGERTNRPLTVVAGWAIVALMGAAALAALATFF